MVEHFHLSEIALLNTLEEICLKYDESETNKKKELDKEDKDNQTNHTNNETNVSTWNEDRKVTWSAFYQLNISMMMSKIECCTRHNKT